MVKSIVFFPLPPCTLDKNGHGTVGRDESMHRPAMYETLNMKEYASFQLTQDFFSQPPNHVYNYIEVNKKGIYV